jgi:Flp pilus assembly pilin Flp
VRCLELWRRRAIANRHDCGQVAADVAGTRRGDQGPQTSDNDARSCPDVCAATAGSGGPSAVLSMFEANIDARRLGTGCAQAARKTMGRSDVRSHQGNAMTKPTIESSAAVLASCAVGASAPAPSARLQPASLLRDQRGLSTAEYAVLFVVVCVGALGAWKSLSKSLNNQVSNGTNAFNSALNASRANNDSIADGHSATQGWTATQAAAPNNAPGAANAVSGHATFGNTQAPGAGMAMGNNQAPVDQQRGTTGDTQAVGNQQAIANQHAVGGLSDAQSIGNSRAVANQEQATAANNNMAAFNDAQRIQQQANAAANNKSRADKSPDDTALKGEVKGDMLANQASAAGPKTPNDRAASTPGTNKGDVKADFQGPAAASGAKGEVKADLAAATSVPGSKTDGHETSAVAPNKGDRR